MEDREAEVGGHFAGFFETIHAARKKTDSFGSKVTTELFEAD